MQTRDFQIGDVLSIACGGFACFLLTACGEGSEPYQPLTLKECMADTASATINLATVTAIERPSEAGNAVRILTSNGVVRVKLTPQDVERMANAVRTCADIRTP